MSGFSFYFQISFIKIMNIYYKVVFNKAVENVCFVYFYMEINPILKL